MAIIAGAAVLLLACGGILAALLLPAVQQGREAARRAQSRNNLKQIAIAMHNYHAVFNVFPPGGIFDDQGRGHHGWQTALLPFLDQQPLYERIDKNVPWDDPVNAAWFGTTVPVYLYPAVPQTHDAAGRALSHYAGNSHVLQRNEPLSLVKFSDGTSQTILGGEVGEGFVPWGHPENWRDPAQGINRGPQTFGRPGGRGCMMMMADGSVREISNDISPDILRALATPAGGERLPLDF